MLELVDRAEAAGFVERRPDDEDGRAKSIAFTPKGLQLVDRAGLDRALAALWPDVLARGWTVHKHRSLWPMHRAPCTRRSRPTTPT